jgi:hypothetical protein
MIDRDHRKWLSFLQKAAALPMDYSVEDLLWLKSIAAKQYPSLVPLISACVTLIRGEEAKGERSEAPEHRAAPSRFEMAALDPLINAFLDTKRFPSNSDLIRFAKINIPSMPDYRFDKMSRQRIARTVAGCVMRAPPDVVKAIEKQVWPRDAAGRVPKEAASFLAGWENVIKNS